MPRDQSGSSRRCVGVDEVGWIEIERGEQARVVVGVHAVWQLAVDPFCPGVLATAAQDFKDLTLVNYHGASRELAERRVVSIWHAAAIGLPHRLG